ncbi:hypothetical protein [Pseudonocardia humida]|nr:hypothetical protein [Pseudonocardia humida]
MAARYQFLTDEITAADRERHQLVTITAPELLDLPGVGVEAPADS